MNDATFLAKGISKGFLNLKEYYQEIDKSIKMIDSELNAMVEWNMEEVMQELDYSSLDIQLPFSGVPIPLKMLGQDKKGWKSNYATKVLSNRHATSDSNFVKRLEAIGFVPVGQSNSSELGQKNTTNSLLYGAAKNPWNLAYSPGGSSGGAAALVASGLFPIASASDGGGSIRIPASYCGLIGLKPTRGAMPTGPFTWRAWQGAAIDFALTVSMRDTENLFYLMHGNHTAAPYHPPKAEGIVSGRNKKILKIGVDEEFLMGQSISLEAKQAIKNSIKELELMGQQVELIRWPINHNEILYSYSLVNIVETTATLQNIQKERKMPIMSNEVEPFTWAVYQCGKYIDAISYTNALAIWDKLAYQMESLFCEFDLILTPTTADSAPLIKDEIVLNNEVARILTVLNKLSKEELVESVLGLFRTMLSSTLFTPLANITGIPAISLPTHITKISLPLGIQFMAAKGREDLLFNIGERFEQQNLFKLPKRYDG